MSLPRQSTYGAYCWHASYRDHVTLWGFMEQGYRAGTFTLTL